jgi:hypothetical protein
LVPIAIFFYLGSDIELLYHYLRNSTFLSWLIRYGYYYRKKISS